MTPARILIISFGVAATTTLVAAPVAGSERCADTLGRTDAIIAAQTSMFSALENEDKVAWERLTVRDFVAFEGGRRFGRGDFFELIQSAHAGGRHFEWTVTSPRLEVSCTLATLTYVNQGSVTQGSSHSAVSWLETATYRYAAGRWRAVFVESMREAQ